MSEYTETCITNSPMFCLNVAGKWLYINQERKVTNFKNQRKPENGARDRFFVANMS